MIPLRLDSIQALLIPQMVLKLAQEKACNQIFSLIIVHLPFFIFKHYIIP